MKREEKKEIDPLSDKIEKAIKELSNTPSTGSLDVGLFRKYSENDNPAGFHLSYSHTYGRFDLIFQEKALKSINEKLKELTNKESSKLNYSLHCQDYDFHNRHKRRCICIKNLEKLKQCSCQEAECLCKRKIKHIYYNETKKNAVAKN